MPIRWFLEGKTSDNKSWIIPIEKAQFIIGRNSSSDLVLASKTVSRKHGEIRVSTGMMAIHDLASTNGTYVNKQKIDGKLLVQPGDIIHFGDFEFMVRCKGDAQQSGDSDVFTLYTKNPLIKSGFAERFDLTDRESELLPYVLEGKTTKEIAFVLNISFATAKNHIYNIFKKAGVHSRIELAAVYNDFL